MITYFIERAKHEFFVVVFEFLQYQLSEDEFLPVYYGNMLTPTQAKSEPLVSFDAHCNLTGEPEGDTLWTLVLTNPDGHFEHNDKEYVHWFM